jgi:dihydrolipoamide dehydrogenase
MTTLDKAQLVIVGAGPGGHAAAFRAADLGLAVTVVDAEERPGGVCLLRGCIPSKALLHAAKVIREAHESAALGLDFGEPVIDFDRLRAWKQEVVTKLTDGVAFRFKQGKVRHLRGRAVFTDAHTLRLGDDQELPFETCIVATGSRAIRPPFVPRDATRVMGSREALDLPDSPPQLLVIGGGYIGLELGSVYAALGSRVTVVEMLPQLMTGVDRDLVSVLKRRLDTQFAEILLRTKVEALQEETDGVRVTLSDKDGKTTARTFDRVLVAVGRRPATRDLGLEAAGVRVDEQGFIPVDALRRTSVPHILAIGDVTGQPMLAHKATHEGHVAAEVAAGRTAAFEPRAIPAVCFTDPEIAWCGLTETEAKAQGRDVKVAKLPWRAIGRTLTLGRDDGLTKLLVDPTNDRVLGVGLAGPGAGELIAEAALAIEMAATAEDLRRTIHAHPTLSESIMEAAESLYEG